MAYQFAQRRDGCRPELCSSIFSDLNYSQSNFFDHKWTLLIKDWVLVGYSKGDLCSVNFLRVREMLIVAIAAPFPEVASKRCCAIDSL
jgi:hypothetical protein